MADDEAAACSGCVRCKDLEREVARMQSTISDLRRRLAAYESLPPSVHAASGSFRTVDTDQQSDSGDSVVEDAPLSPVCSAGDGAAGEKQDEEADPATDALGGQLLALALSTPPAAVRPRSRSPPAHGHAPNNSRAGRARPSTAARDLAFDAQDP